MLHGIVLGKAIWDVDVTYSKFWQPEKYGVSFSKVLFNPVDVVKIKKPGNYKFLVATDLWSVKTQNALEYARKKLGLKIFFLPREAFGFFEQFLFHDERFLNNGKYYFTPDVIFAPGTLYRDTWVDKKISIYVTGHPRFDYCMYENWVSRKEALKKFGLSKKLKTIFFPASTIFTVKNLNKDVTFKDWGKLYKDVHEEREMMLQTLLDFSKKRDDVQVIVKLHPMSSAALRKKGITKDIEGILHKYLKKPAKNFVVIDGKNETRKVARDILHVCDYIIGDNSTMMFEGAIAGKPVLRSLMGLSNNLLNYPGYDDIFINTSGKEDTLLKLNEMVDNGDDFMMKCDDISKYLLKDTKSCERICNVIKREMVNK